MHPFMNRDVDRPAAARPRSAGAYHVTDDESYLGLTSHVGISFIRRGQAMTFVPCRIKTEPAKHVFRAADKARKIKPG
jgi:hypothetical protein